MIVATLYALGFGTKTWCVKLSDGTRGVIPFSSKADAEAFCNNRGFHIVYA